MPSKTKKHWSFQLLHNPVLWIFLALLPALLLYGNRFLIPDYGTDTISYHLFNGQRAFSHPLLDFNNDEFYPVGIATISPGYDLINYLARTALGYRLGTILDLLATVGCVIILYKLMQMILREHRKKFHAGWGLLLVNASIVLELYFQLATYFVDILNAFLVLLVFYGTLLIVMRRSKQPVRPLIWFVAWAAFGILLAFKLTNIGLVLPLAALLAWDLYKKRAALPGKKLLVYVALMSFLILPLVPAGVANYKQTGSPLFPYYNAFFKSDYYPPTSYRDTTFGGQNIAQKVVWPVASLPHQIRLGEPHHIYNDYKLVTYWLLGVLLGALLLLKRLKLGKAQRIMVYYFLSSTLLWGLTFGVNRYLISTLLLGGLMIVILCACTSQIRSRNLRYVWIGLCAIVCVVMLIENYRIIHFNMKYDISWRPPLYQNLTLHKQQRAVLFTRHLALSADQQKTVNQADILLNCHTNVSGLLALMPVGVDKPLVNIIAADLPQYADMANNKKYQQTVLERLHVMYPNKRTFSWVSITSNNIGPTAPDCIKNITNRGGSITTTSPINSFEGFTNVHMDLVSGKITL